MANAIFRPIEMQALATEGTETFDIRMPYKYAQVRQLFLKARQFPADLTSQGRTATLTCEQVADVQVTVSPSDERYEGRVR